MPELLTNPIVQQNLHKNFLVDFSQDYHERIKTFDQKCDWSKEVTVYNRFGYPFYVLPDSNWLSTIQDMFGCHIFIDKDDQRHEHDVDVYPAFPTLDVVVGRMTNASILTR